METMNRLRDKISLDRIKKGIRNPQLATLYALTFAGSALSSRGYLGTNVFERDWDILILLDTCRVDAINLVSDEYDFINEVKKIRSVGGSSPEWIANTFCADWKKEISNTAYLASNGYAHVILEDSGQVNSSTPESLNVNLSSQFTWGGTNWNFVSSEDLGHIEHIWKYEPKNKEGRLGHIEGHSPPEYVTDRAISVARKKDYDRLILHYNQPHTPYTANAIDQNRGLHDYERNPWKYIRETSDRMKPFNTYLDELRYVLDSVQILLDNVDAESVVISADHGEAFGELNDYGHVVGSVNPYVRNVPWVETSAKNKETYQPKFEPVDTSTRDVKSTLEALGYKT